jgi:rRNA maturation endonuclease Nob1
MQIIVSLMVEIPATQTSTRSNSVCKKAVRAVEEQQKTCPHCGSEAVRSEGTDQRVLLTTFGRVALPLRRQRCQGCQRRFRPADACVKSVQGGNVTAALSKACSEARASFQYVTAAKARQRLIGSADQP